MEGQYNMRSPAVKRLMKEAQELKDPTELYFVQPLEDNLFEWHFTIRGPGESEFDGGIYHGRIILPPDYPMKPPSIILLTPNGRFETNKKICLSISGHHPESWQPSWSIRTALLAIIGFMPTHGAGAIGSLDYTTDERKTLAKRCSDPEVFILKVLRVNFSSSELKSPLSLLSQVLKTAKVFPKYLWLVVESQEETDQNKRAFPTASANNSVSALRITSKERRFICRSQTWKCPVCGDISNTLAPLTEASKETSMEAKALASQIDFQSEKEKKARMSSNDKEPTKPLGPPTQTTSNSAATQVPAGVNQDGAMPNYFPVPPLPPMMVQYPFPYRFPCTSENPQNKDPSSTSASPPFLPPYFPPMSYQNFSTLGTQQPKEMPAFHDTLSRNISDSQTSTLSSAFKPPSLQPTNCSNTGVTKPQSTPATAAASVSPKQSASTSQQKNESERSSSLSTPSLNESSGLRQRVIRANSQTYTTTVDQTSRAMSQQEVQSGGTASLILIVLLVMAIGILLLRRFYFSQTSNFNYHP